MDVFVSEYPESDDAKMELVFLLVRKFVNSLKWEMNGKFLQKSSSMSKKFETITYQLTVSFQDLYGAQKDPNYSLSEKFTD